MCVAHKVILLLSVRGEGDERTEAHTQGVEDLRHGPLPDLKVGELGEVWFQEEVQSNHCIVQRDGPDEEGNEGHVGHERGKVHDLAAGADALEDDEVHQDPHDGVGGEEPRLQATDVVHAAALVQHALGPELHSGARGAFLRREAPQHVAGGSLRRVGGDAEDGTPEVAPVALVEARADGEEVGVVGHGGLREHEGLRAREAGHLVAPGQDAAGEREERYGQVVEGPRQDHVVV
mmetsp:Transcript_19241/g.52864  ORF Transcript_19241/g.52864 Transcript_19241/m.52864 type:complete len:234 (-) Transcript_19241:422-1123(-)